jgi:hypothetical protein
MLVEDGDPSVSYSGTLVGHISSWSPPRLDIRHPGAEILVDGFIHTVSC